MYLDPVEEYADLCTWIEPLIGQEISPKNFAQRLGRWLNRSHPTRVKLFLGKDENLDPGDFCIGAEYDPELDQAYRKQLIINLIINHSKTAPWPITPDLADRFVLELVEALVHEYQHQHQYRSRRYRAHKEQFVSEHEDSSIKNEQEYLGNPDEIDAYAANIAARIFLLNYKLNNNSDQPIEEADSLDLKNYVKAFGKDHIVVQKLLVKIKENITYLKDVDDGKIRKRRKSSGRPTLSRRDESRGWFR